MSEQYNVDGIENVISLLDEEGKEHEFTLIDAIETDDSKYVALVSIPENADDESEEELIILQVTEEDGEEILIAIENEDEFNEVLEIFEERLSDFFDIE